MKLPPLNTEDGRRAFAFLAIWGGCMTSTAFLAFYTWMLHGQAGFLFWLALAMHVQLLVGMTAMGWALGRRVHIDVDRGGIELSDINSADRMRMEKEPRP